MIRLNAFVEISKTEDRKKVLELAKELVNQSVKEDGCIAYDIFESSTRPEVLLFCETWKDEATIDIHSKTEHFTTIFPQIQNLCKVKLEKFSF